MPADPGVVRAVAARRVRRRHPGRDRSPRRRRRPRAGDRMERPARSRPRHVAPCASRAAARDDRGSPPNRSLRRYLRMVGGRPGPPGRVGGGCRVAAVPRLDQRRRADPARPTRRSGPARRRAPRPRRPWVREHPPSQGDPGAARARRVHAPGTVGERLRPDDPVGARDRRSVDRARVPAEGGRVVARTAAGRRLRARPGPRARLPGVRPQPSPRRVGWERGDGPRAGVGRDRAPPTPTMAEVRGRLRRRRVLHGPHGGRAVGPASGSDGLPRARGRPDGPAAHDRVDPRRARCSPSSCSTRGSRGRWASSSRSRPPPGWWRSPRRSPTGSAGSSRERSRRPRARRSPPSSG